MRRLVIRTAFLSAAAAVTVLAQSTSLPTFWRYSHPEARALVGVNLKRIIESPMGHRMSAEFREAGIKAKAEAEGFGFLSDVDRLLVSSPGPGPNAKPGQQAPFVVALQGKFDLLQVRAQLRKLGAVRGYYHKVEIMAPGKDSDGAGASFCMAVVGPQTLLLGDKASVYAAIDHHGSADPTASFADLYVRALQLDADNDLWFTSDAAFSDFKVGGASPTGASGMLDSVMAGVKSFEGGLNFRQGLGLNVNLNTDAEENAQKIAVGLQTLMQLAAISSQKETSSQQDTMDLLKKLVVGYSANQVKISLSFDQKELDKSINEAKLAFRGNPNQTVASVRTGGDSNLSGVRITASNGAPAAPPEPTGPLVIRINNPEGGSREVELSTNR